MSLTDRTIGGLLWTFSGTAIQASLSMTVLVILARLLEPAEFGVVGAALIPVGFSQIVGQLGVAPAIVQRSDLSTIHIQVGFCVSFAISCLVGLAVALAAPYFAQFFRMPELQLVIQVLAVLCPINGLSVVSQALLQREMQFKTLAVIQLASYALGYGLVGIALAIAGLGLWALVCAQLAQATINTVIVLFVKPQPFTFSMKVLEMCQLLKFGCGFSLAHIASYAALQADNFVVARWLGAEALGIYSRAYQFLVTPANLFGAVLDKALFPAMASVQMDKHRLGRAFTTAVGVVAMITLPVSGILMVLAPELTLLLLGPKWDEVIPLFRILAVFLVLRTSYKMSESLAKATGAVYQRAWRNWLYAAAVFGGAWVGHFWSLTGVAYGVVAGITLNFLLMLHLSMKVTGVSWYTIVSIHFRHLCIAVSTAAGAWAIKTALLSYELHGVVVLLITGAAWSLLISTLWASGPQIFGNEGLWIRSASDRVRGKKNRTTDASMWSPDVSLAATLRGKTS